MDLEHEQKDLKYGWPFPDLKKKNLGFTLRSHIIIPIVGIISKIILGCNSVETHNRETLTQLIGSERNAPLITVCNHFSCFDDPGLWAILRWRDLLNATRMRWSLAAHNICFTNPITSWFFSSGRCVPVIRGNGVYQQGMDFVLDRLAEGDWVHLFPEGKVNETLAEWRLKWGVGRLVYESPVAPIVLPFFHLGMDSVLPNQTPYFPRLFQKVTVVVGKPIDFTRVLADIRSKELDAVAARKLITDVIQCELRDLRLEAEKLHAKRFRPL